MSTELPVLPRNLGAPVKFNEDARGVYLAALSETGRHECAAVAAGVVSKTSKRYRDANPEFDDACSEAILNYNAWVYSRMQDRIREGSDRLIELELKKIDPAYRDKPLIDMNVSGGGGVILGVMPKTPEELTLEIEANNSQRIDPTIDPDMELD